MSTARTTDQEIKQWVIDQANNLATHLAELKENEHANDVKSLVNTINNKNKIYSGPALLDDTIERLENIVREEEKKSQNPWKTSGTGSLDAKLNGELNKHHYYRLVAFMLRDLYKKRNEISSTHTQEQDITHIINRINTPSEYKDFSSPISEEKDPLKKTKIITEKGKFFHHEDVSINTIDASQLLFLTTTLSTLSKNFLRTHSEEIKSMQGMLLQCNNQQSAEDNFLLLADLVADQFKTWMKKYKLTTEEQVKEFFNKEQYEHTYAQNLYKLLINTILPILNTHRLPDDDSKDANRNQQRRNNISELKFTPVKKKTEKPDDPYQKHLQLLLSTTQTLITNYENSFSVLSPGHSEERKQLNGIMEKKNISPQEKFFVLANEIALLWNKWVIKKKQTLEKDPVKFAAFLSSSGSTFHKDLGSTLTVVIRSCMKKLPNPDPKHEMKIKYINETLSRIPDLSEILKNKVEQKRSRSPSPTRK